MTRVERLFGTLLNRLVKEMRLAGLATREEDNRFLETFLPRFNKTFRVETASDSDLQRRPPDPGSLDRTISYEGQRYDTPALLPRSSVSVEESLSGILRFFDRHGRELPVRQLPPLPER